MGVFKDWKEGADNRDAERMIACLHEAYCFVRHQSDTSLNRAEMSEMLRGFMSSDAVVIRSQRCLYENDDVLVEQSVMDFADGSTEAILSCHHKKDGLLVRTETGATLVTRPDA